MVSRRIIKILLFFCATLTVAMYIVGTKLNINTIATAQLNLQSERWVCNDIDEAEDEFIFHSGKYSIGGNLIRVRELSIGQFQALCRQTKGCVGFTTDGYLKKAIQPYSEWTTTQDKTQGLYILTAKACLNKTNGSTIHIGMSIDSKVIDGLIAVIQSIIENNANSQIVIHIITNEADEKTVRERIQCSIDLPPCVSISYKTFTLPEQLKTFIAVDPDAKYLANTANYARFYLAELLPNVSYLIYLDADLIVKKDIRRLWREVENSKELLVIVPRGHKSCYLNYTVLLKLYYERYQKNFTIQKCPGFNAGVFGINLKMWREKNMLEEVKYWMKKNKEKKIWQLGTQPIMYVISNENWKGVSGQWNFRLFKNDAHLRKLPEASIVHWSGPDKPWKRDRRVTNKHNSYMRKYDKLWDKYGRSACHERGTCIAKKCSRAYCDCNHGYTGRLCSEKIHL